MTPAGARAALIAAGATTQEAHDIVRTRTDLRIELAKAAMQGMLSGNPSKAAGPNALAEDAVRCADRLLAELADREAKRELEEVMT